MPVYGNIRNLQMLQKKYDSSTAHYTETLNTTKDKMTKITAHHNRGCASYEKTESEKRKFYVTAFSSFASPNPPDIGAQEYYDLFLAQAIYGGDHTRQARIYGNFRNLQMLQKKYDSSTAHYTDTTKDKTTKITAHHNRGCASYEKVESEKRKFHTTTFASFASPTLLT